MGYEDLERGLGRGNRHGWRGASTSDLLPPHEERKRIRVAAGVTMKAFADALGVERQRAERWERVGNPRGYDLALRYKHALDYLAKKAGGQA